MPIPNLASLDEKLNRATSRLLGDLITYTPAGGAPQGVNAFVDYSDVVRDFTNSTARVQGMQVEVFDHEVGVEPCSEVTVRLPKRPGKIYRPVGVVRNESATGWIFALKEVK